MSARDAITEAGFGVGWTAIKAMPDPAARRMFDVLAERTYARQGQGVRQLRANLSRVLDDEHLPMLDDITRDAVHRYMRYWCETFRLPAWSRTEVVDRFLVEGRENLDVLQSEGRGAIIVSPHMGNWDHAAAWAAITYGGLDTVVERLKPEGLYEKFLAYRRGLGMDVHPLGEADIVRNLARSLQRGRLVCLLADRDLSHAGVPVDFFGDVATMPAGPAMLSLMTGAPIVPVVVWHSELGTHGRIEQPLDLPTEGSRRDRVQAITQMIAHAFERSIGEHPADWHMMQRLWSVDLDPRP